MWHGCDTCMGTVVCVVPDMDRIWCDLNINMVWHKSDVTWYQGNKDIRDASAIFYDMNVIWYESRCLCSVTDIRKVEKRSRKGVKFQIIPIYLNNTHIAATSHQYHAVITPCHMISRHMSISRISQAYIYNIYITYKSLYTTPYRIKFIPRNI